MAKTYTFTYEELERIEIALDNAIRQMSFDNDYFGRHHPPEDDALRAARKVIRRKLGWEGE